MWEDGAVFVRGSWTFNSSLIAVESCMGRLGVRQRVRVAGELQLRPGYAAREGTGIDTSVSGCDGHELYLNSGFFLASLLCVHGILSGGV